MIRQKIISLARTLILPLSLVVGLLTASLGQSAPTLSIAVGEWKPYLSESLPNQGFAAQILKETFANEGIQVRLRFVPWKRAMFEAKRKQVAGSFLWTQTKERSDIFDFSIPAVRTKNVFFYRKKGGFDWTNYGDLSTLRVGWVDSYAMSKGFTQARKDKLFEVVTVHSDGMGLRMLLNNRLDVFPASILVGRQILHDDFSLADRQKITFHPTPLAEHNLHLLIAKSDPDSMKHIRAFNKGYRKLIISGRLKEIISNALGPEYYDVIPVELVQGKPVH